MSKKIFKLLSISIIFSIYQQTFSNTITASTFELKNSSKKNATIFLNLNEFCPTNIAACKDENDNNCIYITELVREPLSRIYYYLAVPITSKSVKDLTILYKHDKEESPPEAINICLSLFKNNKHETYYSQVIYNWFVSSELYLSFSEGSIFINKDINNSNNYDKGNFLSVNLERIADGWAPPHYEKKITII
ncbi:type VI secretion system protein PdpE [Francisella tularensis]|uniref:type VI secretion system protein PdpE n=1 Tax=Francisella tularensis TaxID=263 RepID=UPI0000F591B1|nr:type VI secretion system protein PdpE [Francisella tularensis]ACD30995.1 conserved hypothetical protein [Francisella tularensis subsp. mediasiatica FSC147]ABO46046.1 hypothetical protein FTW_0042 [Francisella tularensis subsp. tularensis WY96-3418]ABO46449.1 hypothetical protein FTW_0539 [Francisella tularensis subsp. tularensis WY96-3418]ACD31490.1 conserved hypothetical protein [Francisella tularensis subsp. mediasiatica FSC147]AJI63549.1 hypothetical protein CH65_948 [Francisella tularen